MSQLHRRNTTGSQSAQNSQRGAQYAQRRQRRASSLSTLVVLFFVVVGTAAMLPASQAGPQTPPPAWPPANPADPTLVRRVLYSPQGPAFAEPAGVVHAPQHAPQVAPAAAAMSQSFEGAWPATGWSLIDQSSTDGGEYLIGKRNCTPRNGSYAGWALGGGAAGNALPCSGSYPNNADSWAEYGPFDLSNALSAYVSFYYRGTSEYISTSCIDYLLAADSINGADYDHGMRYCGYWTDGDQGNGYFFDTIDLTARLGQPKVWVSFALISDSSVTYSGFTVDDIVLNVTTNTGTPTFTPSATRTASKTPTPTYTKTPTSTSSPTPSPTFTPTRTPTWTSTWTPTRTPTRTLTPTVYPGITPGTPKPVFLPHIARWLTPTPTTNPDPYEPNNVFSQAWGPLLPGLEYRAYIYSSADSQDFYFFDLPYAATVHVDLKQIPLDNDYDLYLFRTAQELLGYSAEYGQGDEHISTGPLNAGRYVIRVRAVTGFSTTQPYLLRFWY